VICKSVDEANGAAGGFDAAIVDMMLNGESTVPFARDLMTKGVPFIFASGYSDRSDIAEEFPGITVVPKPYGGDDLIAALAGAIEARRT
jgi:CheY-like chemotaxis protein